MSDPRNPGIELGLTFAAEKSNVSQQEMDTKKIEDIKAYARTRLNKPYDYKIAMESKEGTTVNVIGCTGGWQDMKKVFGLVDEMDPKKENVTIVVGDLFYDCGIDNPIDDLFKLYEHKGRKFLLATGNHEHDAHNHKPWQNAPTYINKKEEERLEKVVAPIGHTFVDERTKELSLEKIAFYQKKELSYADLPTWSMPGRYGRVEIGDVEFFIVDSTTLAHDYLVAQEQMSRMLPVYNPDNQANWLEREAKKENGKMKCIVLHHPLHDRTSKRVIETDIKLTLTKTERKKLKQMGFSNNNNQMLEQLIFEKMELKFHTGFSAHNHAIVAGKSKHNMFQIISGGGGGELQYREYFGDRGSILCHLRNHGAVKFNVSPEGRVTSEIRTLPEASFPIPHHIKIDHDAKKIIRDDEVEKKAVINLREVVLAAVNACLNDAQKALKKPDGQITSDGEMAEPKKGGGFFSGLSSMATKVMRTVKEKFLAYPVEFFADDAANFFHRYEALHLGECLEYLNTVKAFSNGALFMAYIDKELARKYQNHLTYADLVKGSSDYVEAFLSAASSPSAKATESQEEKAPHPHSAPMDIPTSGATHYARKSRSSQSNNLFSPHSVGSPVVTIDPMTPHHLGCQSSPKR